MKRAWLVWIGFSLCVAATTAAMTWVTLAVAHLEQVEAETRKQAALEAAVRLALWRADAALAPLVTQESLAPWFAYRPFLPNRQPSPFLAAATPHVLVHFQFEPDGRISSPEATPKSGTLAMAGSNSADRIREAEKHLAQLTKMTTRQELAAVLPPPPPETAQFAISNAPQSQPPQRAGNRNRRAETQQDLSQLARNEFDARNNTVFNGNFVNESQFLNWDSYFPNAEVHGVAMTPLWVDENLILARRVSVAGRELIQGCLLDWADVRELLADAVGDLLPAASFQPAVRDAAVDPSRMLAALPLRILPGELPAEVAPRLSPLLVSLLVVWGCLLATAATVAFLLGGILRLSNRASFVTAVTHELRTPLTTFQMYLEMLADNMVPDAEQRRRYVKTLQAESARLTHMVENVLAYARLERGRSDGRVESITLGQLLDRVQGRLVERAASAGMEFVIDGEPAARGQAVRANVSAVEQILFNLVDNACKYAADADDKRIHLELQSLAGGGEIRVRDHGPGLSPPRTGWFDSFSKSAQEAAHSAPGIGLGLALSRRLARHMGGDLRLEPGDGPGACFMLALRPS